MGGPCAHSLPIEASKDKLSVVGLGGPTVLGCLHTKFPGLGALLGALLFMDQVTALMAGEGDVETPPMNKWEAWRAVK